MNIFHPNTLQACTYERGYSNSSLRGGGIFFQKRKIDHRTSSNASRMSNKKLQTNLRVLNTIRTLSSDEKYFFTSYEHKKLQEITKM